MPDKTPGFNPERKVEITEIEAAEALQTEQRFSAERQEYLISKVTDPELSMYILAFDNVHNNCLTQEQAEKLLNQALTDLDVVEIIYITLTESGVDLNESEILWLKRVQEVRDMKPKSEEFIEYEEAIELRDGLMGSSSNNPEAHRSRINILVLQIKKLEKILKLKGELPMTENEKINFELDELHPNSPSKTIVKYAGRKYQIKYSPLVTSRSGKTVQSWDHVWEEITEK